MACSSFSGMVSSDGSPSCRHFKRGDAAGVDDALHARVARRFHEDAGAGDVVAHDLVRVARPQPVVGGDVKHIAHAAHGFADGGGVAQVTFGEFEIEAGQMRGGAGVPHQGAHGKAALLQLARHRRADEAARPGHQNLVAVAHIFRVFCRPLRRDYTPVGGRSLAFTPAAAARASARRCRPAPSGRRARRCRPTTACVRTWRAPGR